MMLEKIMESEISLYEIFHDRTILSWKPFDILKKDSYYDVAYFQDRKYYLMTSEEPLPEEIRLKANQAPDWASHKYNLKIIDNELAFIRNNEGEILIPKCFDDAIISDILGRNSFLISQAEYQSLYE